MPTSGNTAPRVLPGGGSNPPAARVTATDASNGFGALLERVIAGEVIAITRYGKVKAELRQPEAALGEASS